MSYHSGSGGGRSNSYHQSDPQAQYRADSNATPPSYSASSGAATPTSTSAASSSFLSSSIYNAFGGIMRRLSSDPNGNLQPFHPASGLPYQQGSDRSLSATNAAYADDGQPMSHAATFPTQDSSSHSRNHNSLLHPSLSAASPRNNGIDGVYTPSHIARAVSPLRPPPLESLKLVGFSPDTPASARLLTPSIAEEIRIMVPERLRIEEDWKLAYSLDQDGASLATLYEKASRYNEHRIGFVLVVKDQDGGIFGAYLTEYPHVSAHYFGTGECFLWRASVLASLPPPPSANTVHLDSRSTTTAAPSTSHDTFDDNATASAASKPEPLIPGLEGPTLPTPASSTASYASSRQASSSTLSSLAAASAASTQPPRSPPTQVEVPHPPPSPSIRFSAFPYSGVNEYFMYCETHSLSVGGGDGKYGLWLNDSLEKGISATCLTFGNQPLSDEGEKFGVLGVEVWVIGSRR